MNLWFLSSGVLAIATGLAHSYLGEKKLIGPLLSDSNHANVLKSITSQRILRGVWHLPSASWALMGFMTIILSGYQSPPRVPLVFAMLVYLVAMFVNLIATKGKHVGWPMLFIVAALLGVGLINA